ncbi:NAD(P)-dependent alcohol dehydrogenase, partial [Mesorhizobium sp. M7A.F.Ca.CA.002.09.1.1]
MRLVRLRAPGGLGNLDLVEEDPPQPGPGEVLVRIRACALNMRDDFAVQGKMPLADGRVPLSDGAGEVIALGDGVDALRPGDSVVSVFYPWWLRGDMTPCTRRDIPGDSFDGFASEYVCMPAHAFTRAPAGYTHVEAASLTCTGVTAWRGLIVCGKVKPGDAVLVLGSGSVSLFALQFA